MQHCNRFTTSQTPCTCQESSLTERWLSLFTWETQWKQKTLSLWFLTSWVSVSDGEIFRVMPGTTQMVPVLFIWNGFMFIAVLTREHTEYTSVYRLYPLPVRLQLSMSEQRLWDYPAVNWRNRLILHIVLWRHERIYITAHSLQMKRVNHTS